MFEDTQHFVLCSVCVRNTGKQVFARLALDSKEVGKG